MRKSIFDLEMRIDIKKEYRNIKKLLFDSGSVYYEGLFRSLYDFLNDDVFPIWQNKGLFMDFDDFLEKINIDLKYDECSQEQFLFLVEVIINLWPVAKSILGSDYNDSVNKKVIGYMDINMPLIIEKINYKIFNDNGKYRLIKRDSDVDSILDVIPSNYSTLLLDYNDVRNNSIKSKKNILKELDLFIEKDKKTYQSIDIDTYNSIQIIVNKIGVNHPIKEEPYVSFDDEKVIEWYDKCFKLMIHLIRKREIKKINDERKLFEGD